MGLQRQKRRAAGFSVAVLSATLLVGGARAWAKGGQEIGAQNESTTGNAPHNITLEMLDAPLTTAINVIEKKTGVQIAITGSTQGFGKVNVSLRDKSVDEALKFICASAGADLWQQDGVYFVGPKGSAPRAEPSALLPETISDPVVPDWKVEKIHLRFITPAAFLRTLGFGQKGEPDVLEQIRLGGLKAIANTNWAPTYGQSTVGGNTNPVFVTGTGLVQPAAPLNSTPIAAPISANNGAETRSSSAPAVGSTGTANDQGAHRDGDNPAEEFGRGQGFGEGGGGFGGQGGGFGGQGGAGFGGQGGAGAGGLGGQAGAGGQRVGVADLLPPGMVGTDITALDADNSLLLTYRTALQLRQFRQLVQLLDIKPRQVLIRGQFVTVTQNDQSSFGVNWNFTKVNLVAAANAGFSPPPGNTAFIQYAVGNLQTQLSWILTTGRGKLLASPMATTLNGIPAQFNNTETIPVIFQSAIIGLNGNVVLQTTITPINVTTFLAITPWINGDDSLTLVGTLSDTDIIGSVTNPAGGTIPIINTQTAVVTRVIRNGDTMVISGLVRKNDTVGTNTVPLLGDLPLIGTLFRSRNVTTSDSELMVFITPEIIPERPSNAGTSTVGAGVGAPGAGTGGGLLP